MTFVASIEDIVEENRNGLLGMHPSWARVELSKVAEILNGFAFPSSKFSSEEGVPIIRIRNILENNTETYYTGDYEEHYLVQPGELLVGMDGDFNCTLWEGRPSLLNQRVCKIAPEEEFYDLRFLRYVLPGYLAAINANTPSLTVKHLSSRTISEIPLPLPPLNEQRRIVAKIEELFSDLRAGVAALEHAKGNLKRYRVSILKAAVEGRLTEEWRQGNPPTESGSELLARTLTEQRKQWEAEQLATYEQKGKKPPKNWKEKYKEPPEPEVGKLPTLPRGWVWATLSQIGYLGRGRSRHRPRNASHLYGGPYPFVQTGEVRHADTFIREYEQTYSEEGLKQSKLWPAGTLCITIAANIAETAILSFDACFPDSVVGFSPATPQVSVRYVEFYLRTVQSRLEMLAPATAQKNINLATLSRVAVALPPSNEQEEIVRDADLRLSIAGQTSSDVESNLLRAERLRQAILKRAFEGELVEQDPSAESASILLERINAERAGAGRASKAKHRNEQPEQQELL